MQNQYHDIIIKNVPLYKKEKNNEGKDTETYIGYDQLKTLIFEALRNWKIRNDMCNFCGQTTLVDIARNTHHDAEVCQMFVCFEKPQNHEEIARRLNGKLEFFNKKLTVELASKPPLRHLNNSPRSALQVQQVQQVQQDATLSESNLTCRCDEYEEENENLKQEIEQLKKQNSRLCNLLLENNLQRNKLEQEKSEQQKQIKQLKDTLDLFRDASQRLAKLDLNN